MGSEGSRRRDAGIGAPVLLAVAVVFGGPGACATGLADRSAVQEQRLRTPEGYAEWKRRFETLDRDMVAAREHYLRENSMAALHGYELAVREPLDHGFELYRAYAHDRNNPASKEILTIIVPYLDQVSNRLMDVAEEYVKHRSTSNGTAIASEIVNRHTDLPLLSAQRRAETLLFNHRYRRDF